MQMRKCIAGTYTVVIYGYGTAGPPSDFTLYTWVAAANVGNATVVAPNAATPGTVTNEMINWTGLAPNSAFVGAINHLEVTKQPIQATFF
jgi:hypothetical protein